MVDRFGGVRGYYVSPVGVPLESRALSTVPTMPANTYILRKPIEGVESSFVAPWFGQKGLGRQYKLPNNLEQVINDGKLGVKK